MPRSRVEGLLSSFPKLIPSGTQHTTLETDSIRYVYQPLEDTHYLVLLTNRQSNILQDIETLNLCARVLTDTCHGTSRTAILEHAFELAGAWDEVVSLGYRESVSVTQVRTILEMDSHEEKIQEIIMKNKEKEVREERKRREKQFDAQRREASRAAKAGGTYGGSGGSFGAGAFNATTPFKSPSPGASSPGSFVDESIPDYGQDDFG